MALAHGGPWAPGDWRGAVPVFCAKNMEERVVKEEWQD